MNSPKCHHSKHKFTDRCRSETEAMRMISIHNGIKILYSLYECRLASDNDYGLDASRPIYSIEVTNEATSESSLLCCVSNDKKRAIELLKTLHRNFVMPFELKEIYAEIP